MEFPLNEGNSIWICCLLYMFIWWISLELKRKKERKSVETRNLEFDFIPLKFNRGFINVDDYNCINYGTTAILIRKSTYSSNPKFVNL